MNRGFDLGSAAHVERLWSIAGNILTDNSMSMTPLFFECLLLMKVNKNYWDIKLVSSAMKINRIAKVRKQMDEDTSE